MGRAAARDHDRRRPGAAAHQHGGRPWRRVRPLRPARRGRARLCLRTVGGGIDSPGARCKSRQPSKGLTAGQELLPQPGVRSANASSSPGSGGPWTKQPWQHSMSNPSPHPIRTSDPASPRRDRFHHRDRDRMVRFLPLQHRHRPRLRQAVFPALGPLGRDAGGVRHLCGRLHRAADRRRHFRPLRRSHRPQVDADRDAAADGTGDLRGGAGADL